jgi:GntR family transcriptional repressor for pyruvate dehydrogenase complex
LPFRPIEHDRASDMVMRRLEALIVDGVLRSGDRLPSERDLAQRLDVSRPVLREALKQMEDEGLLVGRQGEGTFVADLIRPAFAAPLAALLARDDRAGRDTLEFRRAFEGWTAEMAARRATADDRAMIGRIVAAMRAAHEARDEAREAELDVDLHMTIAEAAHNLVALHVAHAINRLQVDSVTTARPKLYLLPSARERLLAEHLAIAEAVVAGDAPAARARAEIHVDGVAADLAELAAADARERASRDRLELFDFHVAGRRRDATAAPSSRPPRNDESAA